MSIDIQPSILCDLCQNANRGLILPGRKICLDCASDDAELLVEIVRAVMPKFAAKYDAINKQASGNK